MGDINIVMISDSGFYIPTIVAITSIIESKKEESIYNINCICLGMSEEQMQLICSLSKKNATVTITKIDDKEFLSRYKDLQKHNCSASASALIKFDIPHICNNWEKVLYLDGDIIVKKDLSELFYTELKDCYVGAVIDSGCLYNGMLIEQNVEGYFNSGVMLLNLKCLREENVSEKLIKEKLKSTDYSLMDQHVLNKVFANRKIQLKHCYNVLYVNLIRAKYFYGLKIQEINAMYMTSYKNWEDMQDKAVIIHYSSFDKPWKYSDVTAVELWDNYYHKSPLRDTKLKRKKLHIDLINRLRACKLTALPASFIWECETKGLRSALMDVKKFVFGNLKTNK